MRSPATMISPSVGLVEPADEIEQRRLAGARRAHQRDELARLDLEIQAVQHFHPLLAARVALHHVLQRNERRHDCRDPHSRNDTRAPISGSTRSSRSLNPTRTFTVALARSAVGNHGDDFGGNRQSG